MKLITDRFSIIKEYIKGKDVLDLGCVAHEAVRSQKDWWLHKRIKQFAKSVIGIDWNKTEIEKLNKEGYNIVYANAENLNLGKKFDIIVAGEFIEHLSNQGLFLESMKKHMKDDSYLIITTPNAQAAIYLFEMLLFGIVKDNPDHMHIHTYMTLKQLLDRHGFKVHDFYYVQHNHYYVYDRLWKRILIYIMNTFARVATLFRKDFSSTLMMIARKK